MFTRVMGGLTHSHFTSDLLTSTFEIHEAETLHGSTLAVSSGNPGGFPLEMTHVLDILWVEHAIF